MQIFIIIIICTSFCVFISSRPMDEENNRESSDAEYEGNDDSKQDEYVSEDQEPASDEVQRATVNHENKRESQDEFTPNDRDSRVDQNGYKEVSDVDLNNDKEARQNEHNINLKHETDFFPQSLHKEHHSDTNRAIERTEDLSSLRDHDQKVGNKNFNTGQNLEYSGDLLFKISQENLNKERNDQIEIEDQPNLEKQHYIKMQQNKDSSNGRTYENTFNVRDRRETQTHQSEAKNCDVNESSIINNIKKLSDKDLENLLNALPEDKKAILRKIMDKREITKKAGAVDDHGLDSSKLEGSFSIDSKSVSDLATDASEANKQSESEESTTKTQENENDSGKTENKSSLNANGQTLEFNVEAATLSNYNKETFKNDNKREISLNDHRKELQDEVKSNADLTDENSYDSSPNQEIICSDNEDWLESKGESDEDSNTQKREINRENTFENDESIQSLEESFPNADAYDDGNLNMEPLIRVKRRQLNHRVKKRDLSFLGSEVPYIAGFQNNKCENMELNQLENKRFSRRDKEIERNTVALAVKNNIQANGSKLNENSDLIKTPQYSVGSNSEFSSVKGVDGNILYNSDSKNKILVEREKGESVNLIRSGRTIDPIKSDNNFASDNCVDTPDHQREDSFESHLEKFENNLSRSKRI